MPAWLLRAQRWWDTQHFDQPEWPLAAWSDQKVRHIQLHVAKALGKVVAALDERAGATAGIDLMAQMRDEVLPDAAIYRSQLINILREAGVPNALELHSPAGVPSGSVADPLLGVALALSRASARLAAYLEPREHGVMSPAALIHAAIQDLHDSAKALAGYFGIDLARAHQARLETLLGAPLPAALMEERKEASRG